MNDTTSYDVDQGPGEVLCCTSLTASLALKMAVPVLHNAGELTWKTFCFLN
jgi:hypothetical protein